MSQDCLVTESVSPTIAQLQPYLSPGRPILAAESAVAQFKLLLNQFGGSNEHNRWQKWSKEITIIQDEGPCESSARIQALAGSHCLTDVRASPQLLHWSAWKGAYCQCGNAIQPAVGDKKGQILK